MFVVLGIDKREVATPVAEFCELGDVAGLPVRVVDLAFDGIYFRFEILRHLVRIVGTEGADDAPDKEQPEEAQGADEGEFFALLE